MCNKGEEGRKHAASKLRRAVIMKIVTEEWKRCTRANDVFTYIEATASFSFKMRMEK